LEIEYLRGQGKRGPPKRQPKNVFSRGATKEPKKPQPVAVSKPSEPRFATPPPQAPKIAPKPVIKEKKMTPKKEKIIQEILEEVVEEVVIENEKTATQEQDIEETITKEIVTDQILGNKPKKSRGLKQIKKTVVVKETTPQSDRAAALIEQSRKRAMVPVPNKIIPEKKVAKPAFKRRRAPKSSYQPANRAKRLNRSRHMEYKYEMRKLLQDINVAEEHRSSLLGTIWAKGERQTTSDAKSWLHEKFDEGAINDEQKSRLEKVIDDYTIRR
jgi:hypothetical protein